MRGRVRALNGVRAADAAIERPGAQRAAADADQADGVETAAHRFGEGADGADQFGLEREVGKAVERVLALLAEGSQGVLRRGAVPPHFLARDSVLLADHGGQQIGLVKLDLHGCSQSEYRGAGHR